MIKGHLGRKLRTSCPLQNTEHPQHNQGGCENPLLNSLRTYNCGRGGMVKNLSHLHNIISLLVAAIIASCGFKLKQEPPFKELLLVKTIFILGYLKSSSSRMNFGVGCAGACVFGFKSDTESLLLFRGALLLLDLEGYLGASDGLFC